MSPQPPHVTAGPRVALRSSIGEGLRYVRSNQALMGSFAIDLVAMTFGMPRALFAVLAVSVYGAGAEGTGLLVRLGRRGRDGRGADDRLDAARSSGSALITIWAVVAWGVAIAAAGVAPTLWIAAVLLALAGAADSVSAVCRSTINQSVTPDHLRGRMSSVFSLVVTSGPRLGDIESGAVAGLTSPRFSVSSGGLLCVAGAGLVVLAFPALAALRTRARRSEPQPRRPRLPQLRAGRGLPGRGVAQTARRPIIARPSVTSSAYSRSAPTGRPLARRVTEMSGERSWTPRATCSAVASPVVVGFVASTTSVTPPASSARVELVDPQVLGVDAVDRRQRAAEHVVAPAELVRALDRDDVAGLLDDADHRAVTPLVLADRAARPLGEVEADLAEADLLLDVADRVGERDRVLRRAAQDVEREPLRRARADARQLAELGDQALDGRSVDRRPLHPREAEAAEAATEPAGDAAHAVGGELLGRADRLVRRGGDHVLEQLGVLGVDRLGVDDDGLHDEVAADLDGDHPAAGGGLDLLVLELLLRRQHVLLHLLDLLHHLLHVRLGHQAGPWGSGSGTISSASNSCTMRATSSSPASSGGRSGSPRSRSS